jgi:phosphatidylethanolamine N-methyltransferase
MYSIGYAGYYGIALMTASYKVLAISIIAHAAQFAFLSIVEEPHIEATYNPAPPRRTRHNSGEVAHEDRPKTGQSSSLLVKLHTTPPSNLPQRTTL